MGSDIPNSQAPGPDSRSLNLFNKLLRDHPRWRERKPACGGYNCAGHVWASRRTAIYGDDEGDDELWKLVLREDGYRMLKADEEPRSGDLVIYYVPAFRLALHVGMVSNIEHLSLTGSPAAGPIPWILSKWSDSYGEVLHHFKDVPWTFDPDISFWTDRP